jgi:hypothetical protein
MLTGGGFKASATFRPIDVAHDVRRLPVAVLSQGPEHSWAIFLVVGVVVYSSALVLKRAQLLVLAHT